MSSEAIMDKSDNSCISDYHKTLKKIETMESSGKNLKELGLSVKELKKQGVQLVN